MYMYIHYDGQNMNSIRVWSAPAQNGICNTICICLNISQLYGTLYSYLFYLTRFVNEFVSDFVVKYMFVQTFSNFEKKIKTHFLKQWSRFRVLVF